MSDAVMVPREAKRQLIVDLDAAPFTREFFDALNGYATGGSGRCLDTLSIWNARLAASPSVGGWEDDPYLATDLALVNDLIYQHGGDAALAGWVRLCRRITAAPPPPSVSTGSRPQEAVPTCALADIAAERQRQVEGEGWTTAHDDLHDDGEMAAAAGAYAVSTRWTDEMRKGFPPTLWPWSEDWWKPTDRRRDLVKAGALIVAEIERLDRKQPADGCSSNEGAGA